MSRSLVIFSIDDFVDVVHEPDLAAVRIRYSKLHDPAGVNIPSVVREAARFANANGLTTWIADTAQAGDDLSERDAEWVAGQEFRDILLASPIHTFVLIPPAPDTGLDNSWIPEWRDTTHAGFSGQISVSVAESEQALQALLRGTKHQTEGI